MPPPKDPIKYEEMRKKQSESAKRRFENQEERKKLGGYRIGKPSPMRGKKHSEETKQRMRDSHKQRLQS